ncbi:hypothetical protein JRQ81_012094 [Phrynocephalus forsythii]|uniref:HTH CENPB-type domain-containing protein n=1 Tax=Phrynocephalus forsythii TaxID=171643 RepID=A0A9Q0X8G4_9SAUR|nr:hypothetical protein JRQ81_012094 [Phrynocephalus forsythii]
MASCVGNENGCLGIASGDTRWSFSPSTRKTEEEQKCSAMEAPQHLSLSHTLLPSLFPLIFKEQQASAKKFYNSLTSLDYPDVTMEDEEEEEKTDISDHGGSNDNIIFPGFPGVTIKVEKEEEPWIVVPPGLEENRTSPKAHSVGFSVPKPESSPGTEDEEESSVPGEKIKVENEAPDRNFGFPEAVVKMEESELGLPPTQGSEGVEASCSAAVGSLRPPAPAKPMIGWQYFFDVGSGISENQMPETEKVNKRISYSAKFKLNVIRYAKEHGNRAAERLFGSPPTECMIRQWRKQEEKLLKMPTRKRALRGKPAKWPNLEQRLKAWVMEQRQSGLYVSTKVIQCQARRFASEMKIADFTGKAKWCFNFMRREGLAVRGRTKLAQNLPPVYDDKIQQFHSYVIQLRRKYGFKPSQMANMDEVPLRFDGPSSANVDAKGIQTRGREKTRYTAVLSCCADGTQLPPMLILKGEAHPNETVPPGILVQIHEKGGMNEDMMGVWFAEVWSKRPGGLFKKPALLVLDQFRAHLTEKTKRMASDLQTHLAVIPGGLAGQLQPLGVSINKPFKALMKEEWSRWVHKAGGHSAPSGRAKEPTLTEVCDWVLNSWYGVKQEAIVKSFKKCGITTAMDGTEDDLPYLDNDSEDSCDAGPNLTSSLRPAPQGSARLNSVEALQKTEFSRLCLADQLRIRKMGPHRPPLMLQQSRYERGKEFTRKFSAGWYDRKDWLCGCATQDALFCFPCLLFGGVDTWTRAGVRDLKHLSDKIKRHEKSQSHINSCLQLAVLDSMSGGEEKGGSDQESLRKHNEEIEKNRSDLLKLLETVLHCDVFGLVLSEEDEVEDSVHPGVFRGEVNLAAYLGLAIKSDLQSSPALMRLSKTILNDLLNCTLTAAKNHLKEQLKCASFVAIEVSHVEASTHSPTVLIVRYIDDSCSLVERFYGCAELEDHQAETVAKFVLQQLEEVFPEAANKQKVVAQSYDGVTVRHGDHTVQDKIRDVFPNAQYVHSYAHQLNAVIRQAASQIEEVRRFFADLSGIPEFFSCSVKRTQLLEAIVRRQLPKMSQINWNLHIQTVNYVFEKRLELLKCFCEIRRTWKSDAPAVRMAGLFIPMLEDDGEFLYLLSLFHRIMPHVDTFHRQLWSTANDSVAVQKAASDFTRAIGSVQESIGSLFEKLPSESVLPTDKTKETLDQTASEVCNVIMAHTKERFTFTSHLVSTTLVQGSLFRSHHRTFPREAFDEAVQAYPMLEKGRLMEELSVLYERQEFYRCKSAHQLLYVFSMYNLEKTFEQTVALLRILVTTPAMVAASGQTLPAGKRVKTFLTNTAPHNKLSALAMLCVERGMIKSIPDFNLKVVELLARKPGYRTSFQYKQ